MKRMRMLIVLVAAVATTAGYLYLMTPVSDALQDWEIRKSRFRQAALQLEPLIEAIDSYAAEVGHPPQLLDDITPRYITRVPATGLKECRQLEYRLLTHQQGSIVWYDLGSRLGRPPARPGRFSEGNPAHAILVFTLDNAGQITAAIIDRLPKDMEALAFDAQRWADGAERMEMALALADTFRLYGMPREVFENLLGSPDGSRVLQGAPWELRVRCPTGLLNHDVFVYWPTGNYPEHLYGGTTEPIGSWVYVHS